MTVIGIDPGSERTAVCAFDGHKILECRMFDNDNSLSEILGMCDRHSAKKVICEDIVSYGMAVGKEVFLTAKFIGKIEVRMWDNMIELELVPRPVIKQHHCLSKLAKDTNVRQALIDRFGEKGTKKDKGFFYGISGSDEWSACAIAIYGHDNMGK